MLSAGKRTFRYAPRPPRLAQGMAAGAGAGPNVHGGRAASKAGPWHWPRPVRAGHRRGGDRLERLCRHARVGRSRRRGRIGAKAGHDPDGPAKDQLGDSQGRRRQGRPARPRRRPRAGDEPARPHGVRGVQGVGAGPQQGARHGRNARPVEVPPVHTRGDRPLARLDKGPRDRRARREHAPAAEVLVRVGRAADVAAAGGQDGRAGAEHKRSPRG